MKLLGNKTYKNHSDKQLLQAYRDKGHQKSITILYHRYEHIVSLLCRKYLPVEACKDVVSVVFEKLLGQMTKDMPQNIGAWIYTVGKNVCLQELRQTKNIKHIDIESLNIAHEELNYPPEDTEKVLNQLHSCLAKLKKEQAHCIRLFYIEQKTYAELAEITGYSLKQVKSHLQNGRRNLLLKMNQLKKEL